MVRQHHITTTTTAATSTTTTLITPPKRKKGRPSLHDLQQRKLFQQQQQQLQLENSNKNNQQLENPNNNNSLGRRVRSSRRTSNTLPAQFLLGSDSDSDAPDSSPHSHSGSDSDSQDERASKKVRRLLPPAVAKHAPNAASSQGEKGSKATDINNETRKVVGPTNGSTSGTATALPDKKLLLPLLDKLQKKDTRGVFAEPVDPEELPDYHEIIERPMDFGTVREQLDRGHYKSLEQFEDDIFLICSNAMQYNPPSTIFFRQARSIQELAKKEFEYLRQDAGQIELPPRPRRGRPPGSKNQKKPVESSPIDRGISQSPSDATPAPREDDATRSGAYNLRKGPSLYRFPRNFDNFFDISASSSRFLPTKYAKKPCGVDENRRDTYNLSSQFDFYQDPLGAYRDPEKQLIAVGSASDLGYARSLVRFAADLGPVVWRIVSEKIRTVLPPGVEFGPGWIDETKASATQLSPLPENLAQSNYASQEPFKSEPLNPLASGSTFPHRPLASCSEDAGGGRELNCNREWSSLKSINEVTGPLFQSKPGPVNNQHMDGFGVGSSSQFQEGISKPTSSPFLIASPNPHALVPNSFDACTSAPFNRTLSLPVDYHAMMNTETEMGLQGTPYWQNLSMQERWDQPHSADLNGGFPASGSRNSSLPIGSPPQLDLVLQL